MRTKFLSLSSLSSFALVLLVAASPPTTADQFITLTSSKARLEDLKNSHELESDWNCVCVDVAAQPITMIVPNDQSGDPDRLEEVLLMASDVFSDAVLGCGGTIGSWRDAGALAGVELRWSGGLNPASLPGASDHLGTIGRLQDDQGNPLADLYCYDALLLPARIADIETEMGGPLAVEEIWLGPALVAGETGAQACKVNGTENTVHGDVHSAGDFRVTGNDHVLVNQVRYEGTASITGTGHDIPDHQVTTNAVTLPPLPSPVGDYLLQAQLNGTWFPGDVTIIDGGPTGLKTDTGDSVSGVIYAVGRIYVEGNGLTGTITLVSERGVSISGDDNSFTAAMDGVLAIAIGGAVPYDRLDNNVQLDGRLSDLTGSLWAPGGMVEIVTTANALTGKAVGLKIRLAGSENVFSNGCR